MARPESRPGATDTRDRQIRLCQASYLVPRGSILLAASSQRAAPENRDVIAEGSQGPDVRRHAEVLIEPACHLTQPFALLRDALVPSPAEFLLHFLQLSRHRLAPRVAQQQKAAAPRASADVGEAEKVEGLRFAAARFPNSVSRVFSGCRSSANFAMRCRKSWRNRSASARCSKPTTVSSAYRTTSIPHDRHFAGRGLPIPLPGPQVVHVVEVEIRQQRRDHRPLRAADRGRLPFPRFVHDSDRQPFADQSQDAAVADSGRSRPSACGMKCRRDGWAR